MSRGRKGKLSNGVEMPLVGLGTWLSEKNKVQEAVAHALKIGYRHIDGAAVYNNEKEVGNGWKLSGVPRKDIFITSKLWNTMHRPENVEQALDQTLADLQTDYVDLYLIHWPSSFEPFVEPSDEPGYGKMLPRDKEGNFVKDSEDPDLRDTWKEMIRIYKETDKVRAIGVSNFTIREIDHITDNGKLMMPMVNQIETHPYLTQTELCDKLAERNILVTAYSPLANQNKIYDDSFNVPKLIEHPVVAKIAKKYDITGAQVLISFAATRGHAVVPKSITASRIESNFQDVELTKAEMDELMSLNGPYRFNYLPCYYKHFVDYEDL